MALRGTRKMEKDAEETSVDDVSLKGALREQGQRIVLQALIAAVVVTLLLMAV